MNNWRSSLQENKFRKDLALSVVLLACILTVFFFILAYVEKRSGFVIERGWMDLFGPPKDLSIFIFSLTYSAAITGVIVSFLRPQTTLLLIRTYFFLQLLRGISLLIVPLDPPTGNIHLNDPFLQSTFYNGRANLKDLFFSGHVATTLMFAFVTKNKGLKIFFISAAVLVGVMLAIQRTHYIVDVIAAPAFAWLAFSLAKKWNILFSAKR
ncbi:MAG TPA: phosphatase PAP2-related protein [Bacteroidia bacterium]|jgi:hypothetical protein|nr:phosphatase PAP2-related protein [Bacteroidia bacterium]